MKNLLLKVIAFALAVVASVMLFTGCGKTESDSPQDETIDLNVDKNITATVRVGIQQSESEKQIVQAFAGEFNKTYPNVKIEIVEMSGNYTETLISAVSVGDVPDVLWVRDEDVTYYAANDILLNLDEYIAKSGFNASDYYQSMLDLGKINQKGSQYMLPRDYNKIIVYYNKEYLKNAGVEKGSELYPHDDWTYEQFLSLCAKLKSKLPSGVYPVDAMLTWAPIYNTYIRTFGGYIMDENGKPVFDSENAVKGLDALDYLFKSGYTINPANKTEDLFLSGKSAMWFSTRPSISNIEAMNLDYDAVSFPFIGEHGYIGTGASGYAVSTFAKNKALSYLFVESMLSKDSQEAFSKTGNAVPVRKDLATTGKWLECPNDILFFNHYAFTKYPERDCITDYLNNVDNDYVSTVNEKILSLLDDYMGWSEPAGDKAATLKKYKSEINRILTGD